MTFGLFKIQYNSLLNICWKCKHHKIQSENKYLKHK